MSQVCSKCSRINPQEAAYCYWDGAVLEGHHANGGAIIGSRPFPNQFVFPSGQTCRNFDQLAMSCQQNWKQAVDLLKKGFLASFLGGLGRADLALAAQEAARFPDQDRGLDQLLAKLPSHVLEAPKLQAEPTDVNLGVIKVGTDRKLELHLANQGMRLLYGSVVSDCKWLTLGDSPGNAQKLFQFGNEAVVPVQVRGQHLRAGNKPLEGHLVIESNGGTATVTIRATVPITPFTEGVLAGALTPRNIAEKAKAQPKEAAALFEKGLVAQWFKANGWIYPVQGPSASGLGAVQQFFEALGLATAPKLEINQKALNFRGDAGQSLQTSIEVRTPEKRPVYAHATADEPWLDVSKTALNGRFATINVRIPSVPNRPGETLTATIRVTGNGNQRFKVPVTLSVQGGSYAVQAIPVSAYPANPFALDAVPVVAAVPVTASAPLPVVPVTVQPLSPNTAPPIIARKSQGTSPLVHLLPALVLLLGLLAVVVKDIFFTKGGAADTEDVDPRSRITLFYTPDMRFGLMTLDPANPKVDPSNPRIYNNKYLTFAPDGRTNSTVVRIDNKDWSFGMEDGRWEQKQFDKKRGSKATWMFDQHIRVTQTTEIIPGEPIEVGPGTYRRLMDTCLVRYTMENADSREHKCGLRVVVDTLIGENDGVPFTVPGVPGMVTDFKDFPTPESVPDFIQALENPDIHNPKTIAQMNLKLSNKLERPDRVSLTHWPDKDAVGNRTGHISHRWEAPLEPIGNTTPPDSAIVIYWNERPLQPGHKREFGYSYGLGNISSKSGELGITVGGSFTPGGELTVVAYVNNPRPNQTLKLDTPPGFTSIEGAQTQPVPAGVPGRPSPVTWRIRATANGDYDLTVRSSTGAVQTKRVRITSKTIF
jgi:hypothetical protein